MWDALERGCRLVDRLSRLAGIVAGALALAMMLSIGREVVGRYFFNAPTDWVVELDGYLLVALVYLAGGYLLLTDSHLRIDLLYRRFPARVRAWTDLAGALAALPFLGLLVWQGGLLAWEAWGRQDVSVVMAWPLWPPYLMVPLGCLLLLLQVLAQGVRTLRRLRDHRPAA